MTITGRLYRLGISRYVQHNGDAELPEDVVMYARRHGGDFPPYIPLPESSVEFRVSREGCRSLNIAWSAGEPLPEAVLKYVQENGTIPAYLPLHQAAVPCGEPAQARKAVV